MWSLWPLPISTRQAITRALCCAAAAGAPFAVIYVGFLAFAFSKSSTLAAALNLVWPFLAPLAVLLIAISAANLVLQVWRKCDRCGRSLFSARIQLGGYLEPSERRRHRAKVIFGSYYQGAVFQMAGTGRVNWMWCSHEDGANPTPIVTSN